jgi:hypothetical protein
MLWITALGGRLYVRSGLGLTRDWPKNLLAIGRLLLHSDGPDVPVRARHVTDLDESRVMHAPVKRQGNADRPSSAGSEPLTPAERTVLGLVPEGG